MSNRGKTLGAALFKKIPEFEERLFFQSSPEMPNNSRLAKSIGNHDKKGNTRDSTNAYNN